MRVDVYPDRRAEIGRVKVDLWKGLFRDEVRVWVDVRPALGGMLARRTCWRGRGEELHTEIIEKIEALT